MPFGNECRSRYWADKSAFFVTVEHPSGETTWKEEAEVEEEGGVGVVVRESSSIHHLNFSSYTKQQK